MSHQEQATLEYAGACKQMLDEAQKQLQQILESSFIRELKWKQSLMHL